MSKPALIIIDMQRAMAFEAAGERNNSGAEDVISELLGIWRQSTAPIVHVRHVSRDPKSLFSAGQIGAEFQPALAPLQTEPVMEKNVPDAFHQLGAGKMA